jgi:heterogeneous nuclear ribonucleoprotein U-like protein 1
MKLDNVKTNPEIIVMVGLPGSGKSTWRDNFLSDKSYVIVSSDDEIEAMAAADGTDYNRGFQNYIGKATAISQQKFKEAVNTHKNIIWDQTNLNPKKRKGILQQVPKHYKKIAVVFEVDPDELQSRLDKREKSTGKRIPSNVMQSMAKSYVKPSRAEGFDEVIIA